MCEERFRDVLGSPAACVRVKHKGAGFHLCWSPRHGWAKYVPRTRPGFSIDSAMYWESPQPHVNLENWLPCKCPRLQTDKTPECQRLFVYHCPALLTSIRMQILLENGSAVSHSLFSIN